MKVDNLLGPYLYQYKQLFLPGIGLFTLDEKAILPDDTAKVKVPIEGISFASKSGTELDDALVMYVKQETGKMKPLAEADLHSFIATAFQYLNIGKPFYFEGIGTLQKNKDGNYIFTAGTVIAQKTELSPARYADTSKRNNFTENEGAGKTSFNAGKLMVGLGVLLTLVLIGWGGYYLYSKNTSESNPEQTIATDKPVVTVDTTATSTAPIDSSGKKPDSVKTNNTDTNTAVAMAKTDSAITPGTGYKFIFETTEKKTRALKRYEQLKGVSILKNYNNKVALETKDSVSYNIYTIVSCLPADTSHVKDLLNAWYYGTKEIKVKLAK